MTGKRKTNVWRHFTDKGDAGTACNFCNKLYTFKNVNKLENHLVKCLHCPDTVKEQLKSKTMTQPRAPAVSHDDESDSSSVSNATVSHSSRSSTSTPTPLQSSRPGTPSSSHPSSSKQRPLAMFLDRMSDEENVRINTFYFCISI